MNSSLGWIPVALVVFFWLYALQALFTGRMRAGRSLNTRLLDRRLEPVRFWFSWTIFVSMLCFFSWMLLQYWL